MSTRLKFSHAFSHAKTRLYSGKTPNAALSSFLAATQATPLLDDDDSLSLGSLKVSNVHSDWFTPQEGPLLNII